MSMKKFIKVLISLVLIVAMSSFVRSGLRAAQSDHIVAAEKSSSSTLTVYINQLNIGKVGGVVTVDPIQWYEGEAAEVAFLEHEPDAGIEGPPDGYYIVNDDEELTRYPIAQYAEVLMQIYDRTGKVEDMDIKWNESISLEKFAGNFARNDLIDLSQFPYQVTVKDGEVVRIVQQYIP